ncbi:hypothetical protein ASPTUDRAFT_190994 [Aspergillus tubingensis CBS 134.48]|uniref:Arrestin C-terminal-like domain-containing protein n=1 Tax=Aspergillus tubingensis (strain CBS 134.48) TaxID=767770 RepID=A0A1L9MZL5_ASPTC|nr:hypothetical protein ASPTUDRAFT_190994 [Aspergillus tubingensis CBS 134.48]
MINPHLRLDTPQSHTIFIRPGIEPYTSSLPGSVRFSRKASMDIDMTDSARNITISLVRSVRFDGHSSPRTNFKGRWRSTLRYGQSTTKQFIAPCYEETVLSCILWSEFDKLVSCRNTDTEDCEVYYFNIPVPNCLPPTMKTELGTVDYYLKATIDLESGRKLSVSKTLDILYRLIQPTSSPSNYYRRFTASPLMIQTTISQQRPKDATTKAMFSVELAIWNLLTPGARDGEMKYIAISAIKWRVDEVAMRRNIAHCEMQAFANTTTTSKRSLIEGKLEPRCPKVIFQRSDQSCLRDGCLRVEFEIRIPESANAADEICESYCGSDDPRNIFPQADLPEIAINHELKVELITREDTFSGRTNKKLDRKPIAKLYGATYPVRIHKLANDVDAIDTYCLDEPPAFDVIKQMLPPKYEP